MEKVLIIEDEVTIASMIADHFLAAGFQTEVAHDGLSGVAQFETGAPDIVILDLLLPGMDGYMVCRRIRKTSNIPVLMLTACADMDAQLLGYEVHVDDYMTKPFHPQVLVAKAKALLHLYARSEGTVLTGDVGVYDYHGVRLDRAAHTVQVNGEPIDLEPKQFEILWLLMRSKNRVLTREHLLATIWGTDFVGSERVVDSHIKKLRRQLQHKAYLIVTVTGLGYRFEVKQ